LWPAMAGRDHAVTRGRGRVLRAGGGAGAGRRACGREGPCRGAGGVPGRHSRVFVRCRPQSGKASSTTVIRSCLSLPRALHQTGRYGPRAPRYR
jgi:hypothetical protein